MEEPYAWKLWWWRKGTFKNREQKKRKKANRDNLNVEEKEQLRKYEKKGKKNMRDNFGDEEN